MAVAPSFQDLLDQFKAEAQIRRPDLDFFEGDITVAQQHGAAAIGDACIRFAAQSFKETFIDGAEEDALDALLDDHMNLQRKPANAAQVTIEWSRGTSGPGGTIPAGSVVATQFDAAGNTVEFESDADFIVGAGLNGPFAIPSTAVIQGLAGNAQAGTVTRVVDQPVFDPNFTVTNPLAAAGGADRESDEDYRTRARNFFQTLRRGTLASLEFGAQTVAGVAVANAVEDELTGITTVRVADANGNSSQQMINDVLTELENWRCAGTVVNVIGGTSLLVDSAISLVVRAGFNVAAREADLIAAVENRINKLRVGETLFLDMLIGAIVAVAPDSIFDVIFNSLTVGGTAALIGDVTPTASQAVRPGTFSFVEA